MPVVVMVQVDGYTGPGSVVVNGVPVVPIAPTSHQWKIDGWFAPGLSFL